MIRNILFITVLIFLVFTVNGKEAINPTITPVFFTPSTTITVTYDVTGTPLANLTTAYIWVWIPGKNTNAIYNINPANATAAPAMFTKNLVGGRTLFSITFTPSAFFSGSIAAETSIGMLLKGPDWSNGQTTDYIANFWDGNFKVQLTSPQQQPLFVSNLDIIHIEAQTPVVATFQLFVNGNLVNSQSGITVYSYDHQVTEVAGGSTVAVVAQAGAASDNASFQYLISTSSPVQPRPSGVRPGINYQPDNTRAILCLWAPGKNSVYAFGDFSNWQVLPEHLMFRDGEYFWIELTGLQPQQEYGYQYLVNEQLKLADPFADKILDPLDQYISPSVYPALKPYPVQALNSADYFNRVSVFQTGQVPFTWQISNFQKPAKENLVIYEVLLRDYFSSQHRTYQSLLDTLSYLKRLGVNAIELMPIMEFNGNEGWGYNPTFMFAPDKYYGPKEKLKELVDACHANGMAVILDIALNHQDIPNPMVLLDFDFSTFRPTAQNRWFFTQARHPFNVFYDMNHGSTYTQQYVDTVNYYWLKEYKIDGFRFDLSKGFSTTNYCTTPNCDTGGEVAAWSGYDATRIALLKRMADKIWSHSPDAYIILEHLGSNTEEKELAEYRYSEGKGMLLWGNMNHAYSQISMGYGSDADISGVYYKNRSWETPGLVAYMESHDEERIMYRNLTNGNSASGYSVRNLSTALNRIKAASLLFYTVPGPKMLWQFGELGYDFSINQCVGGSVSSNCRLDPKPVVWDYYNQPSRQSLFYYTADLIRLKKTYDVFQSGNLLMTTGNSLVKQIILRNEPYTAAPTSADDMNVVIVANFDVVPVTTNISFPHTGVWFDYYSYGMPITISSTSTSFTLAPGQYRLFTDVEIENGIVTGIDRTAWEPLVLDVFPNPFINRLNLKTDMLVDKACLINITGTRFCLTKISDTEWLVPALAGGVYILELGLRNRIVHVKVVKE
ncbi:MAG: alpha-amylase [Flammeovirgaceae bacterium]|nr:MAG: alpha-amylase [Flammeovirgaceae bacterium]